MRRDDDGKPRRGDSGLSPFRGWFLYQSEPEVYASVYPLSLANSASYEGRARGSLLRSGAIQRRIEATDAEIDRLVDPASRGELKNLPKIGRNFLRVSVVAWYNTTLELHVR